MKKFKLKPFDEFSYEINEEIFFEKTNLNEPYCVKSPKSGDNLNKYFAVCPECDNPIQIIGLYKADRKIKRAYGKHHPKSIENFVVYDERRYQDCPLAGVSKKIKSKIKKLVLNESQKEIYNYVREYFDIAVQILNKELGIITTYRLARNMLIGYLVEKGFMGESATINNIPYMLRYYDGGIPIHNYPISNSSELYSVVKKNFPNVNYIQADKYENSSFVNFSDGTKISYTITSIKKQIINGNEEEVLRLQVAEG